MGFFVLFMLVFIASHLALNHRNKMTPHHYVICS